MARQMIRSLTNRFTPATNNTISIKNSEQLNYDNIEKSINDWKIPTIPVKEVYKKGSFKYQHDYIIKTEESTLTLINNLDKIEVLEPINIHSLA